MDISVEDAKTKIEELKVNIKELIDEKEKYRRYVIDKTNEDLFAARKKYNGKYFKQKTIPKKEDYEYVKAFKIIKVINKNCCECLMLVERNKNEFFNIGVIKKCLHLWDRDTVTGIYLYDKSTPYIMDCYEEISKDDFLELYKNKMDVLEKYI